MRDYVWAMGIRLENSDTWLPTHLQRYPLLGAYLEALSQPTQRFRLAGSPSLEIPPLCARRPNWAAPTAQIGSNGNVDKLRSRE